MKTPFVTVKGEIIERTSGTPQGGVISPVPANMFLHYVFNMWMDKQYKSAPFERYADDGVILSPLIGAIITLILYLLFDVEKRNEELRKAAA